MSAEPNLQDTDLGAAPVRPRRTLRGKLVASFLTVALVTIAALAALAFLRSRTELERLLFDRLTSVAEVEHAFLNRWVSRQEDAVGFLAALSELSDGSQELGRLPPDSSEYASVQRELNTLLNFAKLHADLQEVLLLRPVGGEVVASTDPASLGKYYVDALFYINGTKERYTQNVYASPVTSQPTLTVAAPVRNEVGNTVAVVAGHLNLERIDQILDEQTGLGATGEVYIVSAFNDFVSSKRFGREGHRRGVHSEGVNAAVAGMNGAGLYDDYRGVPVIGAYRWLEERELALIVEMEQAEAFAPARKLLWMVLVAGLVAAFLLTFGVRLLAREIAEPVVSLSEAARRVADGDFTAVAPVVTDDEIGVLATIFNQMTLKTSQSLDSLARARDEAESATLAKSEFLARMSHEIRTPLNAVLGMTHLVEQTRLDGAQRDYVSKIRGSARHLLMVINETLDFSKLEARRLRLECTSFGIDDVLEDLTGLVSSVREAVEVVFQVRPDVPRTVIGDPLRLRQVLSNLLSNAIKFTHEGEIHVLVELEEARAEAMVLRFTVRDTGIGIDEKDVPRLFQAFSQVDESTTRRYGGTGLGLSIASQIVELMGGVIAVEGEPGRGSVFSFSASFAKSSESSTTSPSLSGLKVALFVDYASTREALEELLEDASAVVVSPNPTDAVDADVVIADWNPTKPDEDFGRPTLFLTHPHHLVEASVCLSKPVTRNTVLNRLRETLSMDSYRDKEPSRGATNVLGGVRALVVEDNPIN